MKPPMKLKNAIVSRIKIMSNLDIAERRLPQDGRIKLKLAKNKEMDYRVSVLPTLFGEKVVLQAPRQVEPPARHDQARLRGEGAQGLHGRHTQALGNGARHRPHRKRQDHDALLGSFRAQQDKREHLHGRGPGRVQPHGHQPGPDARGHRPQLRGGAPEFSPPGPGHHHGRRDQGLRDGRDSRQGGAHRPPCALDAPHQRRAVYRQQAPQHGHRAVPGILFVQPDTRPEAREEDLQGLQGNGADIRKGAPRPRT